MNFILFTIAFSLIFSKSTITNDLLFNQSGSNKSLDTISFSSPIDIDDPLSEAKFDKPVHQNIIKRTWFPFYASSSKLFQAIENNDLSKVENINPNVNLNRKNRYGETPLHVALKRNRIEIAKVLINKGVDLEKQNEYGDTALHLSIMLLRSYTEIANILINKDVNLEVKNSFGGSPLHLSIIFGRIEIANVLINKGVDLEDKNSYGETPLHLSIIFFGFPEIAYTLINKGVNLEMMNKNGFTPLQLSIYYGRTEIANLLIKNGANMEAKYNGRDALEFAKFTGRLEIVRLIIIKMILNQISTKLQFMKLPTLFYAHCTELIKYISQEHGINDVLTSDMSISKLKDSRLMKKFIERYISGVIGLYENNKNIFDITHCADKLYVSEKEIFPALLFPDYNIHFSAAKSEKDLIELIRKQRAEFINENKQEVIKRQHPNNLLKLGKFNNVQLNE